MVNLKELIESELRKNRANVDVKKLYEALGSNRRYSVVVRGSAAPTVGLIGEWSEKEKNDVKEVMQAAKDSHEPGYVMGLDLSGGVEHPNVAKHRELIKTLEGMESGDIAKITIGSNAYYAAAFPYNCLSDLVLLVKNDG